jgi:hypothetical protein
MDVAISQARAEKIITCTCQSTPPEWPWVLLRIIDYHHQNAKPDHSTSLIGIA